MGAQPAHDNEKSFFQWFVRSQVAGSVVLLAAAATALIWANSPWSDGYFGLVDKYVGVSWGDQTFRMSLGHWVADGLMVIFFFVVGLEIKREVAVGQLSSPRKAALPVAAAIGGAIVPALIYTIINLGGDGAPGWGVPMATDIAFALGILAMFGARAPIGLKVFLTALAIADDLAAVLVIAFFYTEQVSLAALGMAGGFMFLIFLAGRTGLRQTWVYVLLGVGAWAGVLASGIHATIAGVLLAMLIPVKGRAQPSEFIGIAKRRLQDLEGGGDLTKAAFVTDNERRQALEEIYLAADDARPPGITLEHALHPVQALLILPIFALFKAGVSLSTEALTSIVSPIGLGIILGLFVGKQVGITFFAWLTIKLGYADMPDGVTWKQLWAVSCLGGIGFTMAIFIAELAFKDVGAVYAAKTSILLVSVLAGAFGFFALSRVLPKGVSSEQ